MRNPFAGHRERAVHARAFQQMTESRSWVLAAGDPAGRAGALREFAAACRMCAATSRAARLRPLRPGDGILPRAWTDAADLAEAAAYSEQWLAEERLDGTLPGDGPEFEGDAERQAWVRVFTVTGAAERSAAYGQLARAAGERTSQAAVAVLRALGRAYLIQVPAQAPAGAAS